MSQKTATLAAQHFHLFNSPTVIVPSQHIFRRIFNPINRGMYKKFHEKIYTYEKFLHGAIKTVILSSLNIRQKNFDRMREISTERFNDVLMHRCQELPSELLNERLDFNREHFINGFIYASFFSHGINFLRKKGRPEDKIPYFYSTFVFYIDRRGKRINNNLIPENFNFEVSPFKSAPSIGKLLREPKDFLICNLTLARRLPSAQLDEYGRWRITQLNFFDLEYASDKIHIC